MLGRSDEGNVGGEKGLSRVIYDHEGEVSAGRAHVHTAVANSINDIDLVDTLLRDPVVQRIVKLMDCRRQNATELLKSYHLDTVPISAVIAVWSKARKGSMGLD